MKHLHVGMCLVALPILLGCPKVEPCNSIEDGDKIEVTLVGEVEEYIDYEPLPSCGGLDAPPMRSVLKMADGVEQTNCTIAGCPDDFPSPSEPLYDSIVPGSGREWACTRLYRKVRIDGCEAERDVAIRSSSADFFSPSSTVVLIRRLGYSSGGELQCADPLTIFPPDTIYSSDTTDESKSYFWCSDAWIVRLARK